MSLFRHLIRRHPTFVAATLLAAMLLKIFVPAGFMPVTGRDGTITVRICSGMQDGPKAVEMALPGLATGHGDHQTPAKAEMPCAFAGLAMPMLSGTDPLLLALAIAFVMALASRVVPSVSPRRARYLCPPLRGPPTA